MRLFYGAWVRNHKSQSICAKKRRLITQMRESPDAICDAAEFSTPHRLKAQRACGWLSLGSLLVLVHSECLPRTQSESPATPLPWSAHSAPRELAACA